MRLRKKLGSKGHICSFATNSNQFLAVHTFPGVLQHYCEASQTNCRVSHGNVSPHCHLLKRFGFFNLLRQESILNALVFILNPTGRRKIKG